MDAIKPIDHVTITGKEKDRRKHRLMDQLYKAYKKEKDCVPGYEMRENARGQNDLLHKSNETAKKVGEQVGVSEKTVRRAAKKVEAIEKAGKIKEYQEGRLPKSTSGSLHEQQQIEGKTRRVTNNLDKVETIQSVDLFCGAGGLTCGLKMAGLDVKAGFDVDPACKHAYEFNNDAPFIKKDVTDLLSEEVGSYFSSKSLRLIAGCAPCQTFSTYNQKASASDSRWWLLGEFTRIVQEIGPEFVTMENVPGLGDHSVFSGFIETLQEMGYKVSENIVECCNYGIPQTRRRLVVLASRLGEIRLLSPDEFGAGRASVKEAIGTLPAIGAGEVDESDPLHQTSELSSLNIKRMRASKPGGTWRDWRPELVASCHKKKTGMTYPSVYGRMEWDKPSPTITTQFFGFGNGRFGHPEQDRAISLREGAILQSFPRDYQFTAPGQPIFKKVIGRFIGNAVPVKLGEVIGRSFIEHLKSLRTSAKFNP